MTDAEGGALSLDLLRSFVAVARERHIGRAAASLPIGQPALSKRMQRLEQLLGVQLLVTSGRSVELTVAGEALLARAASVIELGDRAIAEARAAPKPPPLRIGFVAGAARVASALLGEHVDAPRPLQLERVDWADQLRAIRERRVDLGLVRLPIGADDIAYRVVLSEPRLVGVHATHRLAGRDSVSIDELRDDPIIDTTHARAYWTVDPRPDGSRPKLGPRADSVEEMLAVVAAGRAVCLTPRSVALLYPGAGVAFAEVTDVAASHLACAWRRDAPPRGLGAILGALDSVVDDPAVAPRA